MPSQRQNLRRGKECFVRYPKLTYATIQFGLLRLMSQRDVGKNGWPVMVTLASVVYEDGRLGRKSAAKIMEITGLTADQVARGMKELKRKGFIEPITMKTLEGRHVPDHSGPGHVAQYRFTKEAWSHIERSAPEEERWY